MIKKLLYSGISLLLMGGIAKAQCPPQIVCPSNIIVKNDPNKCGAVVNYTPPVGLDTCVTGTDTVKYSGSIAYWKVPSGVTKVTIEARGAEGGTDGSSTVSGGLGAVMIGDFNVIAGNRLKLIVGEKPTRNGGGGGTFVTDTLNGPMIIAGGGGGSSGGTDSPQKHGNVTTTGGTGAAGGGTGGTSGNGGNIGASFASGAGGGLLTDGQDGWTTNTGGSAFVNGGAGGAGSAFGGFGGGGTGSGYVVGGGGGGYSGGGSGSNSTGSGVGGGGGSYNGGTSQNNTGGANTGHGMVIFSWQSTVPTGLTAGLGTGSFFPVGTTTETYVAANGSLTDTCSFTVTVIDSGQATVIGSFSKDTVCTSTPALALPAGTPAGGTYSGVGVSGTSFDPAVSGVGSFWVYYTDTVGCANTDSTMITVEICAGVEEGALAGMVQVSPNPSNGLFRVQMFKRLDFIQAEVYDAVGKQVWNTTEVSDLQQINLRSKPEGMYYLKLKFREGMQIYRLVKQ